MNQYGRFTKRYQLQLIKEDIDKLQEEYNFLFDKWMHAHWIVRWYWSLRMSGIDIQITWCKGQQDKVKRYWEGH